MSQISRRNVTEAFVDTALEEMKAAICDIISIEIAKSIDSLKCAIVDKLVKENEKLQRRVTDLEEEVADINDRLYYVERGLNDTQQRSRRENLEITGIPIEILDENLEECCISILNVVVDEEVTVDELEAVHRLPAKFGETEKSTILRFNNRRRRDEVFSNRSLLKDTDDQLKDFGTGMLPSDIFINENFSVNIKKLSFYYLKLKRAHKINKFMDTNGRIKIKKNNSRWTAIRHELDLFDIFPTFDFDNRYING